MGVTGKLIFATIVAGAGSGFQHGYNIGVVNTPQVVIQDWMRSVYIKRGNFPEEKSITAIWAFAVSIYCVGGIIGSALGSVFSKNIGRRNSLLWNNIFAILAGLLMFGSKYCSSPEMFVVGRFVTGFNCGLNSAICAMYLVEIATTQMRGAIGTVYQLIITMSILLSQILGLSKVFGTATRWPILFLVMSIVGVIQMVLLPLCPESPKYLFVKKGEDKCRKALVWLRGTDNVDNDLNEIKGETAKETEMGKATCKQMVSKRILRNPLIMSIMIMLAQQLSGINAVMYYSTNSFIKAGFSPYKAQVATLLMGAMNVLMTVVSMFLVDISGRKTLLLIGFGAMVFITSGLAAFLTYADQAYVFSILSIIFVVAYVIAFAVGPGSIPWFLVAEFFTQDARPLAASIAAAVNWGSNFLVGMAFPPLEEMMGPLVFIIFVAFQIIFVIYILLKIPETRNKTYEEISDKF